VPGCRWSASSTTLGWTDYTLGSSVSVFFTVCKEQISMVILERRVLPFTLRFEKKSKRISPDMVSNNQVL